MAGRHRKHSQVRSTVAKRGGTGLAAAAISITGLSTAVVTGTTAAVAPNVQLMALVSAANSTSQFFAGSSYYGTDWTSVYGEQEVVPFFRGPQGIADYITGAQDNNEQTGVTASGWGAGQTGTALGLLAENDPEVLESIGLVILDNNSNRAGGGFWTTYSLFAPLLFTSAEPTPSDIEGLTVLDVAYEYNINSDAAVDPLNPFAVGNSLAAYAFGYGAESRGLNIKQTTPGGALVYTAPDGVTTTQLNPGTHYVVNSDGSITAVETDLKDADGNDVTTTYVTVDSGNLPLTGALRLLPGGDILADALDPTLTELVDAGYDDGKGLSTDPAIPVNPAITRPMKPGSSLSALGGVPATIPAGLDAGVNTAKDDLSNPTNLVTKPLDEIRKLPGISSLTNLSQSTSNLSTDSKGVAEKQPGTSSSTGGERPRPLKKIADDFNSSLKKFANEISKNKPAESENDED